MMSWALPVPDGAAAAGAASPAITADKAVAATVANMNLFIVVPSFFCFRF